MNKLPLIDIEKFKKFEHKEKLPQMEIKSDIEAFVIRTNDDKEMSIIIDLNKRLLYPMFGSIKRDDGSEW